jgi:hypothetical protein
MLIVCALILTFIRFYGIFKKFINCIVFVYANVFDCDFLFFMFTIQILKYNSMKKLLLLFFLMTISLGYSQTFPLDFSDSSDLFTGFDGVTASIVSDGGNDVLQILGPAGEGGTWDNSQLTLSQNLNLSDNANNTITFRFKASAGSSGQHLLKFEGGVGGAAVAEGFFNSTGTDWQNITINFGAGLGNYSKVVIFTDSGAASNGWNNSGTGTYLIDDLAGGTNVAPPVVLSPAAAASTPSRNAADVISIFSGAYTDVAGTNFFPNWGQATQYSQVSIAGNPTLKYSNLNYQGITFGTPINGSSMESLHFDIWTADCSSFDMFILDGSNPEEKYTVTPTLSGWNSYDINLSSYPNLTKSNLVEFKIVGNGTVYLDNIYFWKSANLPTLSNFSIATKANGSAPFTITPPNSNSSGDFTYTSSNPNVASISGNTITITGVGQTTITANQAAAGSYIAGSISAIFVVTPGPAPAPTASAANVIPIFTDAYPSIEQTTVDTFRTVWSSASLENIVLSGNNTLSYSSLGFVGIETTSSPVDASGMNLFHIDVYTATTTTFKVKLVDFGANGVYGGDDTEHEITLTTQIGWNSFNLLLSSFTGLTTTAHIAQYILSGNGSAYVDNIYFAYQTITVPPALSGFSIPSKATGDADFAITPPTSTSPGTFTYLSSNTSVATIVNGNSIRIVGIGTTTITANQAASGNYTSGSITASFEVTAPIAQAPTTAAPTPPARNAWDVVSIFSGAYANVTLNELPTDWSQLALSPFSVETIAGNATWKFGGEFLGMVTNYVNGIDLTQMTTMHIDYWTPDNKIMIAKIVNTTGPTTEGLTIVQDPVVTGTWRSVDIPMTQFGTSVNKSKITQILLDPQLGGSTVYVDNFYFYRPESSQPSPTITNFTVPSKLVGDSAFTLSAPTSNSSGAFTYTSSNPAVATISGSTVTIVGGGTSIITANQTAAGGFGPGTIAASFVVSFPPPATAAATPTVPADRVLSIFSNAYTNEGGASYPYWGQPAGYIAPAVVQVGTPGNSTLKVDNLTYQGVQLASNIDVSSMTTLHVDIWTPNCTTFEFFLIDSAPTGVPPVEQAVSVSLLPNQWNSIDIPMSSYNTLAKTAVQQFKFVGTPSGSFVYLDNIYFTKPTPRAIAPTVADVSYCKGAVATPLTATGFGGALKWYTGTTNATTGVTTYGTSSATAPTPSTTTSGTKKYQVSQVLSDGSESPRATITVTTLTTAVPTQVVAAITSTTAGATAGTYLAATLAVGQYVQTSTTVSYRVPALTDTTLSYYWTVPAGVNIVGQTPGVRTIVQTGTDSNVLNVNFLNVASGIGAVGSITCQAQNASGCSSAPKSVALTKALPAAPTTLVMTEGTSTAAITSFAKYMGTSTVLNVTAGPLVGASSYVWELPTGVTLLSGATTTSGITSGTSNVITINFAGVTSSNTFNYSTTAAVPVSTNVLRIGVQSRNGVGVSTTSNSSLSNPTTPSTAKLLTLTAVAPAAPASLTLTDGVTATAITVVSKFIGKSTTFKLIAATSVLASSYSWELPTGVNRTDANGVSVSGSTSTAPFIYVNFAGVTAGTTSLVFGVKAKNGIGSSSSVNVVPNADRTAKLLTVTAPVPTAPATLTLTNGVTTTAVPVVSTFIGKSTTFKLIAAVSTLANTYSWELPTGVNRTDANGVSVQGLTSTDPFIYVNFANVLPATTSFVFGVKGVNGVGSSVSVNAVPNADRTAKLLTVTATIPAAPATLTLTDGVTATAITVVSKFIGTDTTFKLTAVASVLANSYLWELPTGVNRTDANGDSVQGLTSTEPFIFVNFENVPHENTTISLVFGVKAVNGVGSSSTKPLTVTAGLPSAVATVSGLVSVCNRSQGYEYTITAPAGATSYIITAPVGSTVSSLNGVQGASNNILTTTDLTFKVVYSGTAAFPATDKTLSIRSRNVFGPATAAKAMTLTKVATCPQAKVEMASPVMVSEVSIYPNPARDNFNLELTTSVASEMSMTIYSMNGATVRTKNIQLSEGNNVINEDISSLANGIYFVRFNNPTNNEIITKKLIKE